MLVIAEATKGKAGGRQFRIHKPEYTLMDRRMPVMTVLRPFRRFAGIPAGPHQVLTSSTAMKISTVHAGRAQGYLLKDCSSTNWKRPFERCTPGLPPHSNVVADRLAERMGSSDLTGRELEVLEQIVRVRVTRKSHLY